MEYTDYGSLVHTIYESPKICFGKDGVRNLSYPMLFVTLKTSYKEIYPMNMGTKIFRFYLTKA